MSFRIGILRKSSRSRFAYFQFPHGTIDILGGNSIFAFYSARMCILQLVHRHVFLQTVFETLR